MRESSLYVSQSLRSRFLNVTSNDLVNNTMAFWVMYSPAYLRI